MEKITVIEFLKFIKPEEWKDFEKFAASPYFNKGRNYLPLLKLLKKYHPEFNSDLLTKEFLYKKLYPGKEFNSGVISVMLSGLNSLCEEFFIQQCLGAQYFEKRIILFKELMNRFANGKALKVSDEIESYLDGRKLSYYKFRNGVLFNEEKRRLNNILEKDKEVMSSEREYYLNSFYEYFLNLLDYKIYEKSLKLILKKVDLSYEKKIAEYMDIRQILNLIRENDYDSYLILNATYLSGKMLNDIGDDSYFYELENLIENNIKRLDKEFYLLLYADLYHVSGLKKHAGKKEFGDIQFRYLEKIIQENYLKAIQGSDTMSLLFFRSFLKSNIEENPDRVEYFTEKYISKFAKDMRSQVINYSSAHLSFERKDYDKAIYHNNLVKPDSPLIYLDHKILYLKIFYEKDLTESALSMIDSVIHYIKSNIDHEKDKFSGYKKFLAGYKQLIKYRSGIPSGEYVIAPPKLKDPNFPEKKWFKEKIDEIRLLR